MTEAQSSLMKLKLHLTLLVMLLIPLGALARDFSYTYEGQTLIYTVIDEAAKTCTTKEGHVGEDVASCYAGRCCKTTIEKNKQKASTFPS